MTAVLACALVLLTGRNDGSPLVAIAHKAVGRFGWWPPLVLVVVLPLAPLCGVDAVARSLESLYAPGGAPDAMLAAVLVTLGLSVVVRVPTSITLAMVGAMSGAALVAEDVDWTAVRRVLLLGVASPVIACLLAWGLAAIPWELSSAARARSAVARARVVAFVAMSVAYAANDGQKVLLATALAVGGDVAGVGRSPWLAAGTVVFAVGIGWGLSSSAKALRSGVFSPLPVAALWAQTSTALVVGAGSVLGTPLSMTQALTGSVLGVGLRRGRWSVRWEAAGRVAVAWAWTLPVAGLLGYAFATWWS